VTSYEDHSLHTTWQLSLDQITREDECAAKLLKLWAYFNRQDVWYELLRGGQSCEWLERVTRNQPGSDRTMRLLCSYGLVGSASAARKTTGSIGYNVHSCVHAWLIHVVNQQLDEELARLALRCIASMVPNQNADEWWLTQRKLLLHVARCNKLVADLELDMRGMEWALHAFDLLYADQGKLEEAEMMYLRALQGTEEALGPKHTSTLDMVNNLGNLYKNQGKLEEAETIYLRVLQGYQEALGADHVQTYLPSLSTMWNMGDLYVELNQEEKAVERFSSARSGFGIVLGHSSKVCQRIDSRL